MLDGGRREFSAGRACARRALGRLGWARLPILTGPCREPLWPAGAVGAITHCDAFCAAAVARAAGVAGLGIDAEVLGPLPEDVAAMVCTEDELRLAGRLPGDHWTAVIFSAKEAIYKAWYPIARRWLDYRDAELSIDAERGRFQARILASVDPAVLSWNPLEGRFAIDGERVYAAVALPRRPRPE
jgi:4'-phosphopantetheinyl transferase EntD